MIRIVVDTTADLPADVVERYQLTVVPVLVQLGGESLRDMVDISRDALYERLIGGDEFPKTAAPPVGFYVEAFQHLIDAGHEVICISIGAALSATYSSAVQAARAVGGPISCVDSTTVAAPLGFLAIAAAEAAEAGATRADIVALLERLRHQTTLYMALDTLKYLEKGGRISRVRAFLGTMLSVKPLLQVRDSAVLPVEQVRTWKRVPERLLALTQSHAPYRMLGILYTTDRQIAEQMADLCAGAGLLPREQIRVVQLSAALGCHVGPGALGVTGLRADS